MTTFFLQRTVDTGHVILRRPIVVGPDDTAGDVHDRLAAVGAEAVVETVRRIAAGTADAEPQDDALASPAPKIFRDDARDRLVPARPPGPRPRPRAVAVSRRLDRLGARRRDRDAQGAPRPPRRRAPTGRRPAGTVAVVDGRDVRRVRRRAPSRSSRSSGRASAAWTPRRSSTAPTWTGRCWTGGRRAEGRTRRPGRRRHRPRVRRSRLTLRRILRTTARGRPVPPFLAPPGMTAPDPSASSAAPPAAPPAGRPEPGPGRAHGPRRRARPVRRPAARRRRPRRRGAGPHGRAAR